MAHVIIILITFCAIMFYRLYKQQEKAYEFMRNRYILEKQFSDKYRRAFFKMRDTVYYDPYTDEITMCNRLMPVGRLEHEEEN